MDVFYPYNDTTGQCTEFIIEYVTNSNKTSKTIDCTETNVILTDLSANSVYDIKVWTVSENDVDVTPRYSTSTESDGQWTCKCKLYIFFGDD